MKKNNKKGSQWGRVLSALWLLTGYGAQANELAVGVGVATEQSPYRDYDRQIRPIPLLNYENDDFFIKGFRAGLYALNSETHKLYATISYLPVEFKSSRTDDKGLQQLTQRRASVMAGIGYTHQAGWGSIHSQLMMDISEHSEGTLADLAYGYPWQFEQFTIEPAIGVTWQNRQFNNYYFGVTPSESEQSGLRQYKAESGSTPYLALSSSYFFNANWQALLFARYTRLSDAITDSPMTSRSSSVALGSGIIYRF